MGVDAIGLVFYKPSPRHVEIPQAASIVASLPPFVTVVALFVNAEADDVSETLRHVRIDLLQFHGDEKPEFCASFGKPWIKALRVKPGMDVSAAMTKYAGASGFLLDAWHPDAMGGTGHGFDWSLTPPEKAGSVILAGGLRPENVVEALRTIQPYALDVSTGVETDTKGIKDVGKMAAFLEEVHRFDSKRL